MSGAPAQQNLPIPLPTALRRARFHDQHPAARALFADVRAGAPNAAAIAIELLRRELMQLTAVVAEQNRLIQNMHHQLFPDASREDDFLFEGSASPLSEPILPYTIGVGREVETVSSDARRRGLGRGLEALFRPQTDHQADGDTDAPQPERG